MILYRSSDNPRPSGYEPRAHWLVEFHADTGDMPFPLGTAYVTDLAGVAWIDFIVVVDQFRRQGVGAALGRACLHRWPGIHISENCAMQNPRFVAHLRRQQSVSHQWVHRAGCEPRRYPDWL